jgi:hypothetical protein
MDGLTMGATVEVWVGDGAIDGDGGGEDMEDSVEGLEDSVAVEALAGCMAEEASVAALAADMVVGGVHSGGGHR